MGNIVLQTESVSATLDEKEKILYIEWTEKCGNVMDTGENKDIVTRLKNDVISKYHIRKIHLDISKCHYVIKPEMVNQGLADIIQLYFKLGGYYYAVVLPEYLYTEAGLQANRIANESNYQVKLFREKDKSLLWLSNIDSID
jgi:hypothetical protein